MDGASALLSLRRRRALQLLVAAEYVLCLFLLPLACLAGESSLTPTVRQRPLVLADTASMGFNIVLTAVVNVVFAVLTHFVASAARRPLVVGFLTGASTMLCQLNFTSAVYWSQLSRCLELPAGITPPQSYTCARPGVYRAIGLAEGLLFLAQLCALLLLHLWQENFLDTRGPREPSLDQGSPSPLLSSTGWARGTTL